MYYIGTHQQCIDYDNAVTAAEKYVNGDNWANPEQSQTNPNLWAILKACPASNCPRTYNDANMLQVETLPANFYAQENE